MKNKMFFSEGRLVFETPPKGPKPTTEQQTETPAEGGAVEKIGVKQEGVKLRVGMGFEQIKAKVGNNEYVTLLTNADARGEIYSAKLPKGFEIDLWVEADILKNIKERIDKADLKGIAENLMEGNESELKTILKAAYQAKILKSIKSELKRVKPIYDEYVKDHPDVEASYRVMIGRGDTVKIKLEPSELNENLLKKDEETKKETTPEQIAAIQGAKVLKKTPLGKLLKFIGFKDADFKAIASGENIFGVMLFGMSGYRVAGVDKHYEELKGMIPEDKRGLVDKWEKRLSKSSISPDGNKKSKEIDPSKLAYTGMKAEAFKGFLSGKKLDRNYSLEEGYSIPEGQEILVSLSSGARITIPKGKSLVVGGKVETADQGDKIIAATGAPKIITGEIPAGVKFAGSVYVAQQQSRRA